MLSPQAVQNLNFIGAGNTFAYNADTDTVDITIAGEGSAMTLDSPTDGSYTTPGFKYIYKFN